MWLPLQGSGSISRGIPSNWQAAGPERVGRSYRSIAAGDSLDLWEDAKRRDFNRIALGAGLSPLLTKPTLAQWYEGQSPPTQPPPQKFNIVIKNSPRTYNQVNVPRKFGAGRRFTIYWSWSYPWEANRDLTDLDNRFSTITEVRRVAWPNYEKPEFSEKLFMQGIGGTLELFHLSTLRFQNIVGDVTGQPVIVYQRIDQAGQKLPIDNAVLDDTDTLMVFGLDHMLTEQEASQAEIEAIKQFLTRQGKCLLIGPHHDVGATPDVRRQQMEYMHHGDALVGRQQRFGLYTRTLMKGLGVPVENRWGLRPAVVKDTNQVAPLTAMRDLDTQGWLANVSTFNFHQHLPHYALTTDDTRSIRVLARQPIDLTRPHPFIEAGNTEFNTFLWMPPSGSRAGHIVLADLTVFTTAAPIASPTSGTTSPRKDERQVEGLVSAIREGLMSHDQFGNATRRGFLGTATAATALTLGASPGAEAQPAPIKPNEAQTAQLTTTGQGTQPTATGTPDWTKPAAMAIPKEGYFNGGRGSCRAADGNLHAWDEC